MTYDILMIAVFVGAILFGAWKGLAWQIASLAAILVSYIVALQFSSQLAAMLQLEAPWNRLTSMLILFLGTSLVIWLIYGRIKGVLNRWNLSGFDRQAGALLGAAKGALLCIVITMFAVSVFGSTAARAVCQSRTGGVIVKGIDRLTRVVPDEIHEILEPYVNNFNQNMAGQDSAPPAGGFFNSNGSNPATAAPWGNGVPAMPASNPGEIVGGFGLPSSQSGGGTPLPPNGQQFQGQFQTAPSSNQAAGGLINNVFGEVFDSTRQQLEQSTQEQLQRSAQDALNRLWNGK